MERWGAGGSGCRGRPVRQQNTWMCEWVWDTCTQTESQGTLRKLQPEWEQKFPEECKLGGFSPCSCCPRAVPWTAGAGPADRLPPCPCPPCSGSCRRAGGGCTRPVLQDTQGTRPVSAGLGDTQHCHTHTAMTRVSDSSKWHREKARKTLTVKAS